MKIVATNKPVIVRFKADGKSYSPVGEAYDGTGSGPFDEVIVQPGDEFDTTGVTLVSAPVEQTGTAPDFNSPGGN